MNVSSLDELSDYKVRDAEIRKGERERAARVLREAAQGASDALATIMLTIAGFVEHMPDAE